MGQMKGAALLTLTYQNQCSIFRTKHRAGRPPVACLTRRLMPRRSLRFAFVGPCQADLDDDSEITIFDFLASQNRFDPGCL